MARKSLFPSVPIDEALVIATTIWDENAGNTMRRLTLFQTLSRQPDSSTSRSLISASSSYGLTEGSYAADQIKLTDLGRLIVGQKNAEAKLDADV